MNGTTQNRICDLQAAVIRHLRQACEKPYLPVWGELYCALREISQQAKQTDEDVRVYEIHPSGTLRFAVDKQAFVADIPELDLSIVMDLTECADALSEGRFSPFPPPAALTVNGRPVRRMKEG